MRTKPKKKILPKVPRPGKKETRLGVRISKGLAKFGKGAKSFAEDIRRAQNQQRTRDIDRSEKEAARLDAKIKLEERRQKLDELRRKRKPVF